ncbi:unnamed protein product [Caenorhabditis nigoni]
MGRENEWVDFERQRLINQRRSDVQSICSTGIDKNSINIADTFPVVYDQFVAWLREHNFQEKSFAFVCELIAQYQFLLLDQSMPAIFRQWNNIVTVFQHLLPERNYDNLPGESRKVPFNVDPNWKTRFQSARLVFGRTLPLVSAAVYRYFADDDYAKCQFCRNGPDGCTGLVHEQYPYDVYEQLVEPSVFATAAKLNVDYEDEDEGEDEDEE